MLRKCSRMVPAAVCLAFGTVGQLMAGGFYLELGNPQANREASAMKAVLTVRATGCHEPEKALITARAVGVVAGQRRSIPIKMQRLKLTGAYAVPHRWPAEGVWVIQIMGRADGRVTSALVVADSAGVHRTSAKYLAREATAEDVEAFLAANGRRPSAELAKQ